MIEKIEILQHGEDQYLSCYSCEETGWFLCIVTYHQKLVLEQRKVQLNSLSETLVGPCGRCPILPIQSERDIEGDVGCLKLVLLYKCTLIPIVPKYHVVVVLPLLIFEMLQIWYIDCCHIIGMNYSPDTTQQVDYGIPKNDKGVFFDLNKGIRQTYSEYQNFMNSVDCFYDEKMLEHLSIKEMSADIIVSRDFHFNETPQQGFATILPTRPPILTFIHHTFPHQSTFFKPKLFENTPYDGSLRLVADVKLYIQIICVEQCSLQLIDDIICRWGPDGVSMAQNEQRIQKHHQIVVEVQPSRAIQDYEALYLLDKSTLYKLMHLIERIRSRR